MRGYLAADMGTQRLKRVALTENKELGPRQRGEDTCNGLSGRIHEPGPDSGIQGIGFRRGVATTALVGFVTKRQAPFGFVEQGSSDGNIGFVCGYHSKLNDEPLGGGERVQLDIAGP